MKIRKYAKPKQVKATVNLPTVNPILGEISNNTSKEKELSDKLNELYKNIKSAPSYSAKITEFLRHHDVHSKFKRIEKKTFLDDV